MAKNEVATKDTFSGALTLALNEHKDALPADFNTARFVQNAVSLLNGNDTLADFAKQYGTAQIKAGLVRGAFLGLDFLNSEAYLIPYKNTLSFMPSYKGMAKLCQKYSTRKIKSIYAKCVREGDDFSESVVNGEPTINYSAMPFNGNEIIGVFAVCQYEDGGICYEVMSRAEVEQCRKSSKANNSPAWNSFWSEMAKKTVLRRLCKSITLDMDAQGKEALDAGLEIETDVKEISKREIEEEANSVPFDVDAEVIE